MSFADRHDIAIIRSFYALRASNT